MRTDAICMFLMLGCLAGCGQDVDEEIAEVLPLKNDFPKELISENFMLIELNCEDSVYINGIHFPLDSVSEEVRYFYEANMTVHTDDLAAHYETITPELCESQIMMFKERLKTDDDTAGLNFIISQWEMYCEICELYESRSFRKISHLVNLELSACATTSYGAYIQVHNEIIKVVNDLRILKCNELGWGNYFDLEKDSREMSYLQVLVPEIVYERPISSYK